MATVRVDGIKLDEETAEAVRKMAAKGLRVGKGERKPVTLAELCSSLVSTGVFRRIAANKWAKAHPAKAHPKKSSTKGSKKPAPARKAKKTTRKPSKAPKAAPAQAPASAPSVLD